jgi:nucleoside-diphosphate-sugar epimerase
MAATNDRTITVFGGTGFLGRRIVRNLRAYGFPVRTASRHPGEKYWSLSGFPSYSLESGG